MQNDTCCEPLEAQCVSIDGSMEIDTMDGWYVSEDEADEELLALNATARASGHAEAPF